MKRYHAVLIVLAVLAAFGLAGRSDYEAADLEFRHYCRMVALHESSAGEFGWPDYKDAKHECDKLTKETAQ